MSKSLVVEGQFIGGCITLNTGHCSPFNHRIRSKLYEFSEYKSRKNVNNYITSALKFLVFTQNRPRKRWDCRGNVANIYNYIVQRTSRPARFYRPRYPRDYRGKNRGNGNGFLFLPW